MIVRDITERKRAEEVLAKSEERFRTLLEDAPIGICNTDLKGKITYVNKKFEEATGYSREEIVGKNGFKLGIISGETLKLLKKRMKERLVGKPSRLLEGRFKRKDGAWIWAEVESRVVKKFGVPVGFQLFARDITERKRAEEERKRFEEKLSALNIYSRNLNTAKSMEKLYEVTLDAVEKTLGFEFADILIMREKTLYLATHRGYSRISSLDLPLDGDQGITVRAARTGKPVFVPDISQEEAYVEGGFGMHSELAVPIKTGDRVLGVLNVESKELDAFDEKDQELLEILASHAATAISNLEYARNLEMHAREIQESQEKFKQLFMDNPEACVYFDSDFHILDVNARFSELFGYSLDEIRGKHIDDVIVPKDKVDEAKMLDTKALKGYIYYDTVRKRKDGSFVPVSVSAAPITVESKLIGTVGLYRDITEAKMWEERLSALNFYSGKINTASDFQQVYEMTLEAMEQTLGFEHAAFMIVDKSNLRIASYRGYPESLSLRLPLNGLKKGITVRAAITRKPVSVPDVTKDKDYVEGAPNIRSELAVPIEIENTLLGVLDVESKKLAAFNERDMMLLQILASHAATAISSLEKRREIEKRSSQLASLLKSSTEMISTTDLRQRLEKIAEAIRTLGWRRAVIYVTDENLEIRSLEDIVAAGITPEEREYLWSTRQPGQVYRERFGPKFERFKIGEFYYLPWNDPFVRKSFSEDTLPSKLSPEEMIDWDPQDLLMAPLRLAEGRFVGMLSIDDPLDGRRPTKESLAPLELFLHQAAVAIENAQLFRLLNEAKKQIKGYADQLELKVEERTKELMEAQNRLLKAERLAAIGEVAAMVGHDLRNPLTGIAGATYYLKTKLGSNMDPKAMEMAELI
ncbi:MAG: PAS domain S-box protein, partial [Candidatus Bathyarchaeota archaeon]|nr:PAS domain S-box protein [Candidatus Bathyarchaeota archaeon]